jgi:asparagine synthase (glutamine-hydrolysing)
MCGIAGAVTTNGGRLPPRELAERMCTVIRHRGPDDQGVRYEGQAFLGMRRLSIIDLEGGHQPIPNEDKTVWIVFNGEIYNFQELRPELEAKGHRFYTRSDSECIVHAYEEWGTECFARLRGMFALAIWDERKKTLVLARDRFGKKPLYYTRLGDGLAFASELKSLLALPDVRRELSPTAVRDYLVLGYVPTPGSIFKDIAKLPPSHSLTWQEGKVTLRRYWELRFEPKWQGTEAELEERLRAEIEEAVRVRLVSDVPFGAFLSGGQDSSVVVSMMARNMNMPVKTFSIGFEEREFSELDDARLVARHVGAEHHELVARPDAVALLPELVWYFDEPFGDSSLIPTYLVSKMAREHVKMVLSGDGGDEILAGYDRYRRYQVVEALGRLPLGLGAVAPRVLATVLPRRLGERSRWLGERVALPYPDDYLAGVGLTRPPLLGTLLGDAFRGNGVYDRVRAPFLRGDVASSLDRVIAGDMATYLTDDILVKVDRASMASSLEARAPLLDHKLAEFCARLPVDLKLRNGVGKHLLRSVARRLLPPACAAKKKQGFAIPLARWFRGELSEMMSDVAQSRGLKERGVFDARGVAACLRSHLAGEADHGEHLWLVLTFELWARRFLDAPA